MKTKLIEEEIKYIGSQLAPHWIYKNFKLQGDAIVAFIGECEVKLTEMVDIEDVILFPNTSPRLEKFTNCLLLLILIFKLEKFKFSFFLQNLNKIPTLIHANICVNKSKNPIKVLSNKLTPTVPNIKSGPELFVKASNLSASSLVQVLFSLSFVTIFAPTGYPLIIPIINGKAPSPGTLKMGRINLLSILPKNGITLV